MLHDELITPIGTTCRPPLPSIELFVGKRSYPRREGLKSMVVLNGSLFRESDLCFSKVSVFRRWNFVNVHRGTKKPEFSSGVELVLVGATIGTFTDVLRWLILFFLGKKGEGEESEQENCWEIIFPKRTLQFGQK
jgi:hypothetical protein